MAIAEVINQVEMQEEVRRDLAFAMARMLETRNPRFKWITFVQACGVVRPGGVWGDVEAVQ